MGVHPKCAGSASGIQEGRGRYAEICECSMCGAIMLWLWAWFQFAPVFKCFCSEHDLVVDCRWPLIPHDRQWQAPPGCVCVRWCCRTRAWQRQTHKPVSLWLSHFWHHHMCAGGGCLIRLDGCSSLGRAVHQRVAIVVLCACRLDRAVLCSSWLQRGWFSWVVLEN